MIFSTNLIALNDVYVYSVRLKFLILFTPSTKI
jgi:hypothetical protein